MPAMLRTSDVCLDRLFLCLLKTKTIRNVKGIAEPGNKSLCLVCSEQTVEEQ